MRSNTLSLLALTALAKAQDPTTTDGDGYIPAYLTSSIPPGAIESYTEVAGPAISSAGAFLRSYIVPLATIPSSIRNSLQTSIPPELSPCISYFSDLNPTQTSFAPVVSTSVLSCYEDLLCYLESKNAMENGGSVPSTCDGGVASAAQMTAAGGGGQDDDADDSSSATSNGSDLDSAMTNSADGGMSTPSSTSGGNDEDSSGDGNDNDNGNDTEESSSTSDSFSPATAVPVAAVAAGLAFLGAL